MKLSLAMIVKGTAEEAGYLDKSLDSVRGVFDEIIVVANAREGQTIHKNVAKTVRKYGGFYSESVWNDDFSEQRNLSFQKCTGEIIFWMDADDIIDKPEKIREVAELMPDHIDAVFLNYVYDMDELGGIRTEHERERLIRNNGTFKWVGRLHETLQEVRKAAKVRNDEVQVIHTSKDERRDLANERNMRILKLQLEDEGDNPDPRTLFYLAACYRDAGLDADALALYELYVKMSGWDEERAQAYCQIAAIKRAQDQDTEAQNYYLQAIKEDPESSDAYTSLAEMYLMAQDYKKTLIWVEKALALPAKETMTIKNPLNTSYRPLLIYAEASFQLGKIDQAINAVKKAQEFRNDELTKDLLNTYMDVKGHKLASEAFVSIVKFLDKEGESSKALTLLEECIPDTLIDSPIIGALRKKLIPPKTWPKKSVVIFTGNNAIGEWGPWDLENGIGGSEEAIIRLSKRLLEQGYSVTVFASPGANRGEYDGVEWKNYWELDLRDTFDVFVAWRSPWFFDAKIDARKKYLWIHDVMNPNEFTSQRLMNLDKVILLSKYHRTCYPNIPDEKIMLSANGIDGDEFEGADKSIRDPHKIVYMSSHTRGLINLLDIWPTVKAEVPDATLDIMYGWDSYIAINRENPERMAWMENMKKRINVLDGVTDYGKVGQDKIVDQIKSAGVWAYPCFFPEISCITAMKAQAGGAVPVTSNYAALNETVRYGHKLDMKEWDADTSRTYKDALIAMLTDTERQKEIRQSMILGAQKDFSWSRVAQDWIAEWEK